MMTHRVMGLTDYENRTGHRAWTCSEVHGVDCPYDARGQDCIFDTLFSCKICGQAEVELTEKCPGPIRQRDDIFRSWKRYQQVIIGKPVYCQVCNLRKPPRGRSVPDEIANSLCDRECPGYAQSPHPGDLWPGETDEDFGYPCRGAYDE